MGLWGQLSRFIVMSPFAGFVGRQLGCWCASQRQPPSAAGAELDCVAAASFAIQPCIKGKATLKGPGKYESTYVPIYAPHPSALFESHSASSNAAVRLADERNWKADLWTLTVGHHCIHHHASCMVVVISAVELTFTWAL